MPDSVHTELTEFYDRTSDRFWSPHAPAGRDLHVIPLIPACGGTLVEYGFGSGSLLFSQVERFDQVVGYDISPALVARANAYKARIDPAAARKISVRVASDNLEDLPTQSVDALVCVATIEHMFDPYKILDEFYRVVKRDGTLVVSVPNYGYLKHRIALLFGQLPKTGTDEPVSNWRHCGWDGGHLHTFTKRAFSILLSDTGWRPHRWSGWGNRFSRVRRRFPGLLSGEIIAVCGKR